MWASTLSNHHRFCGSSYYPHLILPFSASFQLVCPTTTTDCRAAPTTRFPTWLLNKVLAELKWDWHNFSHTLSPIRLDLMTKMMRIIKHCPKRANKLGLILLQPSWIINQGVHFQQQKRKQKKICQANSKLFCRVVWCFCSLQTRTL